MGWPRATRSEDPKIGESRRDPLAVTDARSRRGFQVFPPAPGRSVAGSVPRYTMVVGRAEGHRVMGLQASRIGELQDFQRGLGFGLFVFSVLFNNFNGHQNCGDCAFVVV